MITTNNINNTHTHTHTHTLSLSLTLLPPPPPLGDRAKAALLSLFSFLDRLFCVAAHGFHRDTWTERGRERGRKREREREGGGEEDGGRERETDRRREGRQKRGCVSKCKSGYENGCDTHTHTPGLC